MPGMPGHRGHGRAAIAGVLREAQRSHGHRSRRMHVRKHAAVRAHERRVPRHAHVEFHILRGLAVRIFQAEAEKRSAPGVQRSGLPLPNHARSVRPIAPSVRLGSACEIGRTRAGRIVALQRLARDRRQSHLGHQGLRQAVGVYDIPVQRVLSGRHGRQILGEHSGLHADPDAGATRWSISGRLIT